MLEKDLRAPGGEYSSDPEIQWRLADSTDLPVFQDLLPKYRVKIIEKRLKKGEHCLLAILKGIVVHYCWITWEDNYYIKELKFEVRILPDKSYIYDAFTRPGYRDRGIYGQVLGEWGRRMSIMGKQGVMLYV
ncbi:MAG: hypothetical protein U9N73_07340, partial [Candidatus Auribacterota bacterium]|nr:hypothetical protein [Candidatus Auribacterota bacterium]